MDKGIIFSILISIFLISIFSIGLIETVSADNYFEIEDEWYGMPPDAQKKNNDILDYYNNVYPNQVTIDFHREGGFSIDVHTSGNLYDLADPLSDCIYRQIDDPNANITTLRSELTQICKNHGLTNPNITINSPYGEDCFIYTSKGVGISMEPTLKEGAMTVLNKTHDVHVGDIVRAKYDKNPYGSIIKRVAKIEGNKIYLVSDNVNGTFERNGKTYEYEGLRTWVDISDIQGVVIDVYNNDGVIRV